jgi:hypothetical protein
MISFVRPEPDDEGQDEAESELREIRRKFKEAKAKKSDSVASWVANNPEATEEGEEETDGEYEEIESSEESECSDVGNEKSECSDVGDEDDC